MISFSLAEHLQPLGVADSDIERALPVVNAAINFAEEQPEFAIPSLIIGPDAPVLRSVFLLSPNYLSEVEATGQSSFDFVDRSSINLLRWTLGTQTVNDPTGQPIKTYNIASLVVVHNNRNTSSLYYVGTDKRDEWVSLVRRAFPTSCVLVSKKA
jgi:hypothetical protein